MSRDGDAGMDVESGGRADGQLGDGRFAVAAGGPLAGGCALGDRFGSGEAFEDVPSTSGLCVGCGVAVPVLPRTSHQVSPYPLFDGHGDIRQLRQRGSPSGPKEDVKGRPIQFIGEPGIALVRAATGGDLREHTIGDDEVSVNVERNPVRLPCVRSPSDTGFTPCGGRNSQY
jgi:hypothetical protein